jgi:hypothetical protein
MAYGEFDCPSELTTSFSNEDWSWAIQLSASLLPREPEVNAAGRVAIHAR